MTQKHIKIKQTINLAKLLDKYPFLSDVLAEEFGIFCAMCPMYGFDTLKEAAEVHGIEGDDFKEMIKMLENEVNKKKIRAKAKKARKKKRESIVIQ